MAEPTFPKEPLSGDSGISDHLRSLLSSSLGYVQARLQLAGLESKEAAAHFLKILIWVGIGIAAAAFGYLFFCGAVVFILSVVFHVEWIWILLGLGLAHFGAAFACALVVREKFPKPLFESTFNEFKKDQEWLTTHSKQN